MPWIYQQKTGLLTHDGLVVSGVGYSGHGEGLNNPAMQDRHDLGPIPCGGFTIGPAFNHPEHGPLVMRLIPKPGTNTFGRDGFLMHGDLKAKPGQHLASLGCIIEPHDVRQAVNESADKDLGVIP